MISLFNQKYNLFLSLNGFYNTGIRYDNCIILYIARDHGRKEELFFHVFYSMDYTKNLDMDEKEYRRKLYL